MAGLYAILLAIAANSIAANEPPKIDPAKFMQWFDAAMDGRLKLKPSTVESASRFRYVFIAGFHNEMMPGYFVQNTKELRVLGVRAEAIHLVYPSSDHSIDENRQGVAEALHDIAARGPEKLVIIAHSRGACDAMAFALYEPEFVEEHVEALFMVQGAFGGTGLADYILDQGEPIDRRLSPGHRFICKTVAKVERAVHLRGDADGLPDMTRESARIYWRATLKSRADAVQVIEPRVFYIQSEAEHARLRLLQRATGRYLSTYYGPNDGVVASEDQGIPGVGQIIATLDVGHADLTRKGFASRAGKRARQALVQTIVVALAQPR